MRKQELHPRTAVLNKNQKNQSKHLRSKALVWLATQFPAAFDNSLCIRPLKMGIMDDILLLAEQAEEAGISKSKLREAVVIFTRRLDYLTCLKSREMRIDLQGNPAGEVSLEEAEHAAMKIKKRVEKSARNARKQTLIKTTQTTPIQNTTYTKSSGYVAQELDEFTSSYSSRHSAYSTQDSANSAVKPPSVLVKHKSSRQFDPSAVARLKEKLGLSRSGEKQESVE
jgi:ProP effector